MESNSITTWVDGTGDKIHLWKHSVCGECPLEEAHCKETEVGVHFQWFNGKAYLKYEIGAPSLSRARLQKVISRWTLSEMAFFYAPLRAKRRVEKRTMNKVSAFLSSIIHSIGSPEAGHMQFTRPFGIESFVMLELPALLSRSYTIPIGKRTERNRQWLGNRDPAENQNGMR